MRATRYFLPKSDQQKSSLGHNLKRRVSKTLRGYLQLFLCIVTLCAQSQFSQEAHAQYGLTCPANNESFDRPQFRNDRSIRIYDENRDGLLDDRDIQHALDWAAIRHAATGDIYTVLLDTLQEYA